jgi:hypothetical protein
MRRRRKPVVWLPQDITNRLGVAPAVATDVRQSADFFIAITGPALGILPDVQTVPLVKDNTVTGGITVNDGSTLADIESSGYRLRRVVGKLVVAVGQGVATDDTDPTAFKVTIGLIVLRVKQDNTPLDVVPSYDPSSLANTMDPWMWRRTWCLSDRAPAQQQNANVRFPISNVENYAGGNNDGSHVDAKVARVIGPEERLFLVASCQGIDGNPGAQNPGLIVIIGDLRCLGTMRSSQGNRRNATR